MIFLELVVSRFAWYVEAISQCGASALRNLANRMQDTFSNDLFSPTLQGRQGRMEISPKKNFQWSGWKQTAQCPVLAFGGMNMATAPHRLKCGVFHAFEGMRSCLF
jgi:hypothetical protein